MIETVILDWSGVVSDDWEATIASANEVLEEYGKEKVSREKFRELYELPWMRFYEKQGIEVDPEEEREKWDRIFPKYFNRIKAFPYAKKALEWLKQHNKKVLVLSSHNQGLLEKEIIDYGFKGLIDYVDASNDNKMEKIETMVADHRIERQNTIFVGDMVHDIDTAKKAGIKSVAVLSGYDTKKKLEKANPDYTIKDISELPALIKKLEADQK